MDRSRPQEILTWLRDHHHEMVRFLEQLACAESPSAVPEAQQPILKLLAEALTGLGYRVRHIPGRHTGGHLLAAHKDRLRHRPVQLLLGHCDTVWPLGTLKDMPVVIDNGVMKGPGVYDMKAGLAQLIFALRALRELELAPAVTPVVFINSDEEIGSRESTPYIRTLARIADRALVLEPSLGLSGRLKTARKGVGRFTVRIKGKAAHAGLDPQAGASAILELSHVIQRLFALNDVERGITVNVGVIDGGLSPNVVAPESSATVDVRIVSHEDGENIQGRILSLAPVTHGVTLAIEGRIGRPPMERTPGNQALWKVAREAAQQLDLELGEGIAGGGSDGNTTSLYTPTLDGLGAVGDGAHARHEFVYLDKMVERSALLALLLLAPPLKVNHRSVKPDEE